MNRKLIAAAIACGMVGGLAASPALSAPKGNAYGYWAGKLCDHVPEDIDGVSYWEDRGYESRGACVAAEGQSLAAGEWDPAEWDLD